MRRQFLYLLAHLLRFTSLFRKGGGKYFFSQKRNPRFFPSGHTERLHVAARERIRPLHKNLLFHAHGKGADGTLQTVPNKKAIFARGERPRIQYLVPNCHILCRDRKRYHLDLSWQQLPRLFESNELTERLIGCARSGAVNFYHFSNATGDMVKSV